MQNYKYNYMAIEGNLLCQEVDLPEGFEGDNIHVHHNDELLFVDTHCVVEQVSSNHVFQITCPALIWSRTGVFHQIIRVTEGSYHCWVISYHQSLLADLPRSLVHDQFLQNCDLFSMPLDDRQVEELRRIMVPMRPRGTPQFQRLMYLLSIFDKVSPWAAECSRVLRSAGSPHYVFALAEQLQDLSRDMPNLDTLAQAFFVSKSKLKSDFKRILGMPILAFRRLVQLQAAKALLETTDMDISQISDACGFHDESYFIRVFRKQYALTPGAYRRQFIK